MAFPADNVLGNNTPEYWASMALRSLQTKKGVVRLVSRAHEAERNATFQRGEKINLRRPGNFTAEEHVDGTGTSTQGLNTQNGQITLEHQYEVKFGATDFQRAIAGGQLVNDYIGRAMDAIVKKIEQSVFDLGAKVGPWANINGASGAEDQIVDPLQVLEENNAPIDDGNIFFAVDPTLAAAFMKDPIFHQARMTGDDENLNTLVRGALGMRFGVNIFRSQLAKRLIDQATADLAAEDDSGDRVGAANADYAVNTSTGIVIKGLTDTETLDVDVDTVTFAGDPTVYRVIAAGGAVSSNTVTISLFPALRQPLDEDIAATFGLREAIQDAAAGTIENLMFHRDAFAITMAPLPMDGNGAGAEQATVSDPETGLAIRFSRGYDIDTKEMKYSFDALWAATVLDPMLAVRALRAQ